MEKRQFIAGAKCPHCQAQDVIQQVQTEDSIHFECVDCDFKATSEELEKPNATNLTNVTPIKSSKVKWIQ